MELSKIRMEYNGISRIMDKVRRSEFGRISELVDKVTQQNLFIKDYLFFYFLEITFYYLRVSLAWAKLQLHGSNFV